MTVTEFLKVRGKRAILTEKSNPRTNSGGTPPPTKLVLHGIFILFRKRMGPPFLQCKQPSIGQICQNILGKRAPFLGEFHFNISIPKGSSMQLAMVLVRIFRQLQSGSQEGVVFLLGGVGRAREKKTNKHKHCGRDGVRDKQEPSLGHTGPLPGTNWDLSLLFLFDSTVKSPFCPVCHWDGWGFVHGTIFPQGPPEKCLRVFCLLVSFWPVGGYHY